MAQKATKDFKDSKVYKVKQENQGLKDFKVFKVSKVRLVFKDLKALKVSRAFKANVEKQEIKARTA